MTTEAARRILHDLNDEQRQAVESIEGPLLIVAGPGSGKTRVITHRIAYLVRVLQVDPHRILAVTFTNKAAREMRARVVELLGPRAGQMTMGTFHNFGARLLREHGETVGVPKNFVIYDADDQKTVMKNALDAERVDPERYKPAAILSAVSDAKNEMLTANDYMTRSSGRFEDIVGRAYARYESLLKDAHAVDFDDLLLKPVHVLQQNPGVLQRHQTRYKHVLVDEWQDTNLVQYRLTRLLAENADSLCVVGDPDQSIYSWRHADIRNIMNFERDYPKARSISLGRNYRSTQTIVDAAHNVIAANRERKENVLWTDNASGDKLVVSASQDEAGEALFVAAEVERLVQEEDILYGSMAVMYRTNAQSRAPEEAFVRAGIPYRIVGGLRFWERREIRDVMAYLRVLHNPFDTVSLERIINVPPRGIGKQTVDSLSQWASERDLSLHVAMQVAAATGDGTDSGDRPRVSPQTLRPLRAFVEMLNGLRQAMTALDILTFFDQVVGKTGYRDFVEEQENAEDRWDNVLELRAAAGEHRDLAPDEAFAAFLESAALSTDLDAAMNDEETSPDAVTLITLHQSKGLEFQAVFIIGAEEGLLPHYRSIESGDSAEMEEERRLCYVGMTRARERLYLTRARRRQLMGRGYEPHEASRFLRDIPENLVEPGLRAGFSMPGPQEPLPLSPRDRDHPQLIAPFRPGDRIRHKTFGEGTVVACLPTSGGDDFEVTAAFRDQGVKRLLATLAMLEKLA